jgi:hypothetical protein
MSVPFFRCAFDILMGASSQFTRSGPAVSWKVISPYVQRFSRAGEKDKQKAFNGGERSLACPI